MQAETNDELQQRLSVVIRELAETRSELRSLQHRQHKSARLSPLLTFGGVFVLVLLLILVPNGAAQNGVPSPGSVTRLQAPVLIQDKTGKTIVEISDRTGFKGVTVFSSSSDVAFLGFDKQNNGLVQLLAPGRKIFADIGVDGFKFFGPSGQPVAFMGVDSASNGALQLKNSSGGVLVDAGAIDANTGFAQVYPKSGKSPFPIPNYLKGSK